MRINSILRNRLNNLPEDRLVIVSCQYKPKTSKFFFKLFRNTAKFIQNKDIYIDHCFVINTNNKPCLIDKIETIEASFINGVISRPFNKCNTVKKMKNGNIYFHILPFSLGDDFIKTKEKILGKEYDKLGAVRSVNLIDSFFRLFAIRHKNDDEFFCSELAMEFINNDYIATNDSLSNLINTEGGKHKVHPTELFKALNNTPNCKRFTLKIKNNVARHPF